VGAHGIRLVGGNVENAIDPSRRRTHNRVFQHAAIIAASSREAALMILDDPGKHQA
jgi:hypothetical protein